MAVTQNLDRWKVETYTANTMMLAEQEDSRFTVGMTPVGGLTGEKVMLQDQYGNANDVVEVMGRAEPTPVGQMDYDRSWVMYKMYRWFGPLEDSIDAYQMLHEVTNIHRRGGSAAIGRKYDDLAINDGIFGTRYSGRYGSDTNTFPTTAFSGGNYSAAYVIPKNLEGTDTGLTVEKLLVAQACMEAREVLKDGDRLKVACSAQERLNLKRQIEVASSDYSNDMVLQSGKITSWGIFDFIQTERLPIVSTYRRIPVWKPEYLVRASWAEVSVDILKHSNLSGAMQLKMEYATAATRLHEEGFIEIQSTVG